MESKFDVLIAGAGVAGCLLARNLALNGHSVALMDQSTRQGLGHDWWDSVHLDVFDEVDLPRPLRPEDMGDCGESDMLPPLGTVTIHLPNIPGKRHIDRKLLAARLLKYAEDAGAVFLDQTSAVAPIFEGSKVVGMAAQKSDGAKIELKGKITIDATGINAVLRHKASEDFGFQREIDRGERFVTYREIRKNLGKSTSSTAVFGKNNGVTWINHCQEGLVDFFAGVIDLPGRPEPRALLAEMVRNTPDSGPDIVRGGYGGLIPVRRGFDSFAANGFVLCGDAACQCNPVDGSGVASSLRAASFAATTIHACLENGRVDIEALWPYNAAYQRTQGVRFAALHALQRFLISTPKINIEVLFRRGIVTPKDFWGQDKAAAQADSMLSQIVKLIKLLDRPRFVKALVKGTTISKKVGEHYENYPEAFDSDSFQAWRRRTAELFAQLPPPIDLK